MATFTFQNATILGNGRVIRLVFQTTSLASNTYSTPDWQPGKLANKNITISTGAKLAYIGTCTYTTSSGNLQWIVDVEVVNASDTIIWGQTGVTISADAGYVQDSQGNVSGVVTAQTLTNYSVVGSDGFVSTSLNSGAGTGGSVRLYVSYTYGSDSRTFAQAQSVTTPLKTLGAAYSMLVSNSCDANGSRISVLQGDTVIQTDIVMSSGSGPSISRPLLIDSYWNAYSGINASWQGKRPIISITGGGSRLFYVQNGTNLRGNIVISGLELYGNNSAETAFFGWNVGIVNLSFIDCYIHGFTYNLTIQYNTNNGTSGFGWGNYFMLHRCIITDSIRSDGHGQGLFMFGYANSLLSQNTFDRCSYTTTSFTDTGSSGLGHSCYIGIDNEGGATSKTPAAPPCVWRNFFTRGGSYGVQSRLGGNIHKNLFSEMDIGFLIGSAGGRGALNFVDRTTGRKNNGVFDSYNVWGMHTPAGGDSTADLPGQIRPSLFEMNLLANAQGYNGIMAIDINGSSPSTSLSHDHIIRNNTTYNHGYIGSTTSQSTKPESITITKNVMDTAVNIGATDDPACLIFGIAAPNTGPTSWQFLSSDKNLLHPEVAGNIARNGGSYYTIAQWRSLTGKDTNSITNVVPTYADSSAGLGTYGSTIGVGTTLAQYVSNLRSRGLNSWIEAVNDPWPAIKYLLGKYTVTNKPTLVDGSASSYYGAPSGFDPTETSVASTGTGPVPTSDVKFIIDGVIIEDNGTRTYSNIDYNSGNQIAQVLFQNYGDATGVITNCTLTNITGNSFSIDPTGALIIDPPVVINSFPYNLTYSLFPGGRNVLMSPNSEGTKLCKIVLDGDFGSKTAYLQFTVPTVPDPTGIVATAATGLYFTLRTAGFSYFVRT